MGTLAIRQNIWNVIWVFKLSPPFPLENCFSSACHFGETVSPILSYPRNGYITQSFSTRQSFPRFQIFTIKGGMLSLKEKWVGFCYLGLQSCSSSHFYYFLAQPFISISESTSWLIQYHIQILWHSFVSYRGCKLKLHFPHSLVLGFINDLGPTSRCTCKRFGRQLWDIWGDGLT